jgi:hypothetical protein
MILKKDLILKSGKRLQENSFGKRIIGHNEYCCIFRHMKF